MRVGGEYFHDVDDHASVRGDEAGVRTPELGWATAAPAPQPLQVIEPRLVHPTGDRSIDGLLWGWKWGATTLSVRFPVDLNEYAGYRYIEGFTPFSQLQRCRSSILA
jgi:hypothetical protein